MVSDRWGGSALKGGAVLGAFSAIPPLFLDDRSKASIQMLNSGLVLSCALAVVSAALLSVGARTSTRVETTRYTALTCVFILLTAGLFVIEYTR